MCFVRVYVCVWQYVCVRACVHIDAWERVCDT